MAALLSVQEAQQRIIAFFRTGEAESTPVVRCVGRVLAEDLTAPGDLPPFDNSSMDGFAVQSADVRQASENTPVVLRITADIPAGSSANVTIRPGETARIMTGAPVPEQADAVVPVEDTNFSPDLAAGLPTEPEPQEVSIYAGASSGANIRRRGSDVRQGQLLLERGRRIQPQDVGLIAAIGRASVEVYRPPRVALFSSGDELVRPGEPLAQGQIYDSNQYVLAAMLEREGAEVLRMGTAPDEPQRISELLDQAVEQRADLIVTSAGVSVGAYDYIRTVIASRGSLNFWKVNMRPGKPLAFGVYAGIPLIGLPGNPVSAFVGCLVFVLPAVRRMAGRAQSAITFENAVLAEPIQSDGRESYLRAFVSEEDGRLVARLAGHQGSGNIFSLVQANALLIVPSGVKSLPIDSQVKIWYFNRV